MPWPMQMDVRLYAALFRPTAARDPLHFYLFSSEIIIHWPVSRSSHRQTSCKNIARNDQCVDRSCFSLRGARVWFLSEYILRPTSAHAILIFFPDGRSPIFVWRYRSLASERSAAWYFIWGRSKAAICCLWCKCTSKGHIYRAPSSVHSWYKRLWLGAWIFGGFPLFQRVISPNWGHFGWDQNVY